MSDTVQINKFDETFIKINCEPSIAYELNDYFTFDVPGAKFMPLYRNKIWDGKIRLYNVMTGMLYAGLQHHVEQFCLDRSYPQETFGFAPKPRPKDSDIAGFIEYLKLPLTPRDYQLNAVKTAIGSERALFVSPTASGKSFIIYLLTRFYNERTLIIVPTTSLVNQLFTDFSDYGCDSDRWCHRIYSGHDRQTDKQIVISTWQSLYKLPREFFTKFKVVIGDEAHTFKAKSLVALMTKLNSCPYRFGFTGTLDDTQTNKFVLEGLFGPVHNVTTTAELIENKTLSDFKIRSMVLQYTDEEKKAINGSEYKDEIRFLVTNPKRNKFICDLALNLKGNSLLLFQFVEKHGVGLYNAIKQQAGNRKVFFVHGNVDADVREDVRRITEQEDNAIIVASYGTFSTGINIRKLHNIIFASPTKSRIRTLQSIGRGLRKTDQKDIAILYDIADDLTYKNKQNHTLRHFFERINIYNEQKFSYKIYRYTL